MQHASCRKHTNLGLQVKYSATHVDAKQHAEHQEEFQTFVKGLKDSSVVAESITRTGRPADVIVAVSTEKRADFIVMGVHRADQAGKGHHYGFALDVIRSAKFPVFTLFAEPEREMTEAEEFRRQQERLSTHHSCRGVHPFNPMYVMRVTDTCIRRHINPWASGIRFDCKVESIVAEGDHDRTPESFETFPSYLQVSLGVALDRSFCRRERLQRCLKNSNELCPSCRFLQ